VDRYKAMQTFVHVAKYGSLTAAARSLGISRALVSRQLTDLERRLRVRLLNRSTRLVSLTEAGRRHFEFCDRVLAEMTEEGMALLGNDAQPEGLVAVAAPEFVGDLDVGDALATFSSRYPKLKIELVLGEFLKEHGAIEAAFDVILQTRRNSAASAHAKQIARLGYVTCASPDYLAGAGAPRSPADLAAHRCLVHAEEKVWRFLQAGHTKRITVTPIFASNSFEVLAKAALQGLGVALLPRRIVWRELERRMLAPVLPRWRVPTRALYAVHMRGGIPPRRVRLLLDHLSEWFRSDPRRTQEERSCTRTGRSTSKALNAGARSTAPIGHASVRQS
jgi:DNA-binding transcriptional LysR family regulator